MIELKFSDGDAFGPIRRVDTLNFPKLSLIVGPNGCGKTQLLKLISKNASNNKAIRLNKINGNERKNGDVVYCDWTSFQIVNIQPDEYNRLNSALLVENWNKTTKNLYTSAVRIFKLSRQTRDFDDERGTNKSSYDFEEIEAEISAMSRQDVLSLFILGHSKSTGSTELLSFTKELSGTRWLSGLIDPENSGRFDQWIGEISTFFNENQQSGFEQIDEGRLDFLNPIKHRNSPLQYPLMDAHIAHQQLKDQNALANIARWRKYGAKDFAEIEFSKEHPFDGFNRALKIVELPFELSFIRGSRKNRTENELVLISTLNAATVRFPELSSGEKTLLGLAAWAFCSTDTSGNNLTPKLLLLDEVDAALHPKLIDKYLQLISDVLVAEFGMHVVIATHNVSTVALLRDRGSVFKLCNKDGTYSLEGQSSQIAINDLCRGVATLSVDPSGQLTVFTESKMDQFVHTKVYQLLKRSLNHPKSLVFIGVGFSKAKLETGGGRQIVEKYLEDFTGREKTDILGLTDFDNKPRKKITKGHYIFAENERYTIENAILDPLALLVGISSNKKLRNKNKDLFDEILPDDIREMSRSTIQTYIDKLCKKAMPNENFGDRQEVSYHDYQNIFVPKCYLLRNGHALSELLESNFDFRSVCNTKYRLSGWIIEDVFTICPWAIPKVFFESYQRLLNHE